MVAVGFPETGRASPEATGFAVAATAEEIDAVAASWADLAARATADNVFFHPDFALPAMRHLAPDGVSLATVTTPAGLVAAAPFTRTRLGRIAPAARLWSHAYGPLGAPLVAAEAVDDAVPRLVEGLAVAGGGTVIVPDLPLDTPIAAALVRAAETAGRPTTILDRHERAILDRPAMADTEIAAAISRHRRREYARQMRRLGDLGPVMVESTAAPDVVCARFEEFLVLEAAGWKGRRGTALASQASTAEFARDAIFRRARSGKVHVDSIRVGTRPVAILVSLIAGGTGFTWKITYDEAYARFSPGAHLMMGVVVNLFANKAVGRLDSCAAPNHPMVDPLWPGRMALGTLVVGPVGGGALHRLGLAEARTEIAALDRARRVRRRLG